MFVSKEEREKVMKEREEKKKEKKQKLEEKKQKLKEMRNKEEEDIRKEKERELKVAAWDKDKKKEIHHEIEDTWANWSHKKRT